MLMVDIIFFGFFAICSLFGVFLGKEFAPVWAMVFVVCIGMIVFIAVTDDDKRVQAKLDKANAKVTKTCYPYAVTHKVEKDNKITFACANDGKLRVVEVK